MNTKHLEEALVLCDNMLIQLISEDASHEVLTMLSNIKSKIIYGLDEIENYVNTIDELDDEEYEYKFKDGDQVICTAENDYVEVGTQGIVNENYSSVPFVRWAEDKQGQDYVVWALSEEDMVLVED